MAQFSSSSSAPQNNHHSLFDWLRLLFVAVLWGTAFILLKIAVTEIPPTTLVMGRLWIGAIALLVWMMLRGQKLPPILPKPDKRWFWFALLGFTGATAPFALVSWGQQSLDSALVGILMGLFVTNNTFNIFSLLGVIMLFGIVTRNAILIVDFANQLQERGYSRKEALIEAGRLRLRPVAMTANTLVFALLPVLFSTADGSESRQPLAAVLVGGAITAGLMALLVTPVLYNILEAFGDWVKTVFNWISGKNPTPKVDQPSET